MKKHEQVELAYDYLKNDLTEEILKHLKFAEIDEMKKSGSRVHRGRIYGSPSRRVWSKAWCFYEIGVGNYSVKGSSIGAVGFVCFSENKQCGGGMFSNDVRNVVEGICKQDPSYEMSGVFDKHIAAHKYFVFSDSQNLQSLIRENICSLILATFWDLNKLEIK